MSVSKILEKYFLSESRYGDIVNTKQKVLNYGKSFNLTDFIICKDNAQILDSFGNKSCDIYNKNINFIFQINDENLQAFFIWQTPKVQYDQLVYLILISALSLIFIFVNTSIIYFTISKNIKVISQTLISKSVEDAISIEFETVPEIKLLVSALNISQQKLKLIMIDYYVLQNRESIFQLSQKLAHDIRSPISTLNLISARIEDPDLKSLQQAVVQQINAIANDLLNESKRPEIQNATADATVQNENTEIKKPEPTQFLTKMLKNLEKEYQFKALAISQKVIFEINYADIEVNFATQKLTSVIYACINNFVQNAIEATQLDGEIKIIANKNSDQKIEIAVCDTGKGIPEHILKRLGSEILSFGKSDAGGDGQIKSGNGIALYNANKELSENGAKLVMTSVEHRGTQMRIAI